MVLAVAALAALAVSGCRAGPRAVGPTATVRKYIAAVRADQPSVAYDLFSVAARRTVTRDEFLRRWVGVRKELLAQADRLATRIARPIAVKAALAYKPGLTLNVVLHKDRWQIANGVTGSVAAATPRAAIQRFVAALRRRDYTAVLRALSPEHRRRIEAQIERWVRQLQAQQTANIDVKGDRAVVRSRPQAAGARIELIKVDGQWKVDRYE